MIVKRIRCKDSWEPNSMPVHWVEIDERNVVINSDVVGWIGLPYSSLSNWSREEVPLLVPKEMYV